jgi:predicted ATPase
MPSNALDYITIQGFKSIASIEKLALRPINVVIGPNGSGKSNFLEVFAFLQQIHEGRLSEYVGVAGGAEKVLHFGSKVTKQISFTLSREANQSEVRLFATRKDDLFVIHQGQRLSDGRDVSVESLGLLPTWSVPDPVGRGVFDRMRNQVSSWRIYHVDDTSASSPMRKTARVDDNRFLRADGSNLASFLYFLGQCHEDSYGLIRRTVQSVAPFFDDFLLKPLQLKPDDIKLEWRHKNSDQYFDASSFSDGTLRFIALATLFLQPEKYRPSVILVDEPELGLHPYAIEILAALIRQASLHNQVIVSTQSSLLLDHFDPDDVLVADRVEGGTKLTRLESDKLASWLRDYSLGQLWEKNELGGRPVPE